MNDEILFENGSCKIIGTIEGDPIDWEVPVIKSLCKSLLKDDAPRDYFFKQDLRRLYNKGFKHFFLDPKNSFDPTLKSGSNFFQLIENYKDDTRGELKKLINQLIKDEVLIEDDLRLMKCQCKELTLSGGNWCGHCQYKKAQPERRYKLYYFPEDIKGIFNQPGRIIEGFLYHGLKDLESKGLKIYPNVQLKHGEGKEKQELDLAIINKDRNKALVVLSTISPQAKNEKKQCQTLLDNKINTFFVTTENEKITQGITQFNNLSEDVKIKVFPSVDSNKDFLKNISSDVSNFFKV